MVIKTLKSNGIFLILPFVRDPSTSEREHVDNISVKNRNEILCNGLDMEVRVCMCVRERERERQRQS